MTSLLYNSVIIFGWMDDEFAEGQDTSVARHTISVNSLLVVSARI